MANDNKFITYTALLAIIAISIALRLSSMGEVICGDISIYSYMSHEMLTGKLLYTELWDHKPPGVLWLYMLGELIWGYGPNASTYLGLVFTPVTIIFIFLILRGLSNVKTALLGALLWALASNSVALEANQTNSELFINAFVVIGLWAFIEAFKRDRKKNLYYLVSGTAFAIATVIKMVAVFPLAALCVYLLIDARRGRMAGTTGLGDAVRSIITLSVPVFILWLLVFGYFLLLGRFNDFWSVVFAYNSGYSGSILLNVWEFLANPRALFRQHLKDVWILVILSFAWAIVSRREYGPVKRSMLTLFLIGVIVEIASPGRFFSHYYQLAFPPLVILASLAFYDLWEYFKKATPGAPRLALAAVILFTLANLIYYQAYYIKIGPEERSRHKYKERFNDAHRVANFVKESTAPCETIYNWGDETILLYYSKRSSASGLFNLYPLRNDTEAGRSEKLERVRSDLTAAPPAMIVWQRNFEAVETSVLNKFVRENYTLMKSYKKYDIYEYKFRKGCGR